MTLSPKETLPVALVVAAALIVVYWILHALKIRI